MIIVHTYKADLRHTNRNVWPKPFTAQEFQLLVPFDQNLK